MVKFKDFSRPLSVFQVLFKANLIFKDLQDSPVYSSTFQACTVLAQHWPHKLNTIERAFCWPANAGLLRVDHLEGFASLYIIIKRRHCRTVQ